MEQYDHKEAMNHQAYENVLDIRNPRYSDDPDYMKSYQFWAQIDPNRFDPRGSMVDWDD